MSWDIIRKGYVPFFIMFKIFKYISLGFVIAFVIFFLLNSVILRVQRQVLIECIECNLKKATKE